MRKLLTYLLLSVVVCACQGGDRPHPHLYATAESKAEVQSKIETQDWARKSFDKLRAGVDKYVEIHKTDPEWITSRIAMYWKDGERYTQCYLKDQNWDYGEGNAPVPTLRMPGMRTWNKYANVPLELAIPYNESGDMLGIDRTNPDAEPVIVPYKKSGHMVRLRNSLIIDMARDAAYIYWVTGDENYAKFSSDIYYQMLTGLYYMNPIKDPERSTKGLGGWEPGGICGYYDYEQIHDDLGERLAATYDYLYPYLMKHPNAHLESISKTTKEVNDEVLKRFIELGLIRGGSQGNWNVNGYARIMAPIIVLDSNEAYEDGRGREYYLEYFLTKTTKHHVALDGILEYYDPITGLWDESPGYSFGTVTSLLDFATMLYPLGIDIIADNPILQKAAVAILPWMDARGNLVVFGDTRGGTADYTIFERLLTYYTKTGNVDMANQMASAIAKGIKEGTYSRDNSSWIGITTQEILPEDISEVPVSDLSYSTHHRFFTMKDYNGENKMMATIYGGRKGKHLSPNGLAVTLYHDGYALAPEASGYESYWSDDFYYHQRAMGSNTILPGYTEGDVVVNHTYPVIAADKFTNDGAHESFYRMVDMSADEKRRVLTSTRVDDKSGYYVDIFFSDQMKNDYIFHNVGETLSIKNKTGVAAAGTLRKSNDLGTEYGDGYAYFKNPRKTKYSSDFIAHWDVTNDIKVDFRHLGGKNREIYVVDAPYSTLYRYLTPEGVSASPDATPTLIIRQNGVNGKAQPFVGVYEAYSGDAAVKSLDKLPSKRGELKFAVTLANGKVDTYTYTEAVGLSVERK